MQRGREMEAQETLRSSWVRQKPGPVLGFSGFSLPSSFGTVGKGDKRGGVVPAAAEAPGGASPASCATGLGGRQVREVLPPRVLRSWTASHRCAASEAGTGSCGRPLSFPSQLAGRGARLPGLLLCALRLFPSEGGGRGPPRTPARPWAPPRLSLRVPFPRRTWPILELGRAGRPEA